MMLSPQRSTRTHQKPYKGYDSGVGYSVALPLYRNLDKGERKKENRINHEGSSGKTYDLPPPKQAICSICYDEIENRGMAFVEQES